MACNKNKIDNIEARLAKIAKLKAAIEERLKQNKEVDSSSISLSNAQYENRVTSVEGRVRRTVAVQGEDIVPVKNNPNTINNVLDGLDSNSLNSPKVLPGDFLEIQFIENDYWANNKDKVEEAWMEAPLYLIDSEGNRVDLLEAYNENNINTHSRKVIYEALQEGKKVELQVESKIPNFNNIRIGGMPVFFSVEEQLKMPTFRDIDGNFITTTPENSKPILLIATGMGNEISPSKWNPGDLSYLNPKIQEAIIGDLGDPKRLPQPEHLGGVFALTLTPEGKYSYIKLSTRNLSDKAYNFVLNEIRENRIDNISAVVGNSTNRENAHKDANFLSIETVPTEQGDVMFLNFYSPKHEKAVRITSEEFTQGMDTEAFTFNIGKFNKIATEAGAPNFKWSTSKTIKVSKSDSINPVINEFLEVLKNKKHQVDVNLLTSQENFSIPGFTKPSGYNSYQEYLFDENAHGDNYAYTLPVENNKAILNTDVKNIEGSVYYNTRLIFNDVLIDGKSILTDPSINPTGGLKPAIAPKLTGTPESISAPPKINNAPNIKPEDLGDLTAFSISVGNKKSPPLDRDRAKEWLEERFGKGSANILTGVNKIGNITRHGYFENMAFYIYENAEIGTEYHEGYHGMFRMWLNDKQREALYTEARKKYGIPTDKEIKDLNDARETFGLDRLSRDLAEELVLEEKMAIEFSEYMLTDGQSSPGGKIAKFFKNLWNFIKSLISDNMTIRQSYEMLKSNVVPVTFRRNIQKFAGTANNIEGYTDQNIKEVLDYLTARYRKTIDDYTKKGKKVPYKSLNNKIKNSVLREAFSTREGLPIEGPKNLEILQKWVETRFDGLLIDNNIVKSSPQPIDGEPKTQAYPAQNNHEYLVNIYENWNDIVDNKDVQNLRRIGFESMMKSNIENIGLRLNLGRAILEEVEEGTAYERIYSRSRVEEDMRSKTTSKVKEFLSTIPTGKASYLGYETYMEFDKVYKDVQTILTNTKSFPVMLKRLEAEGKTKPHIAEVYKRLNSIKDDNLRAAFAFTFMQNKNDFFLGKETKDGLQFMNSDRNSVHTRLLNLWRSNATEHQGFANDRHLYKVRQVGDTFIYVPNKARVNKINSIFKSINKIYDANPAQPVPEKRIEDLVNLLYTLGIDISTSPTESKNLLTTYFNEGSQEFSQTGQLLKGVALYKAMLDNGSSTELNRLIKGLNAGKNIYTDYTGILSRFANITMKNDIDIFTSFLNVKNNSIHPINMPTVLNDLILDLKSGNTKFFEPYLQDPFYNPLDSNTAAKSLWLSIYGGNTKFSDQARNNLNIKIVDGYIKASGRPFEFGEMSELQSAYFRLTKFMDRKGKKGYVELFVPNLSDRSKLISYTVPSIDNIKQKLNIDEKDIIRGLIIQDLMRYQQAEDLVDLVEQGRVSPTELIPGFHYLSDPLDRLGTAFQLKQLTISQNSEIFGTNIERYLSDVNWQDYLSGDIMALNRDAVNDALNGQVENVLEALNARVDKNMNYYIDKGLLNKINKSIPNPYSNTRELFRQYELNNMIHKIELQKFTRGGTAFNKDYTDFSKRFGNMETPGYKLLLQGDLGDPGFGFYRVFNEGLMEDFFTSNIYDEIAESITATLQQQGDPDAEAIGSLYAGGQSNKSDAFGVVSIDFYKAFKQGKGEWLPEDEEAYTNYKNGRPGNKRYIDNNGVARRVEPIKTYYDAMIQKNGIMIPVNTKNSYMVLLEEFTKTHPTAEMIRQRMEGESNFSGLPVMHALNTVSAKKLAYSGVENLNDYEGVLEKLTNISLTALPGKGLRIPQIVPEKSKGSGALARQFMINIISNMDLSSPNLDYIINEGRANEESLTAKQVFDLYHNTLVTMLDKSYDDFISNLGYKKLMNAKGHEARSEAQLQLFKNLKKRLEKEIQDKDLSNNYLNALHIEKTDKSNYRFSTPLAFPFIKRKTEALIMGMLKNDIVKQKINGASAKQIAELGGHVTYNTATGIPNTWSELKFLRNKNGEIRHAEVAIRADIAAQYGLRPGQDLNQIPENLRVLIGYRIPNQGKNSMLPMIIKYVLPENYDQAILVPGGITTQMGADFDIDTLYLMMPNTQINEITKRPEKVTVNYPSLFTVNSRGETIINFIELENLNRKQLENVLIDISEAILRSKKHFKEVVQPLDSPNLKNIAKQIKETLGLEQVIDPNDSFSEIHLERMNKDGNSGIGIYANSLSGKNITSYSQIYIAGGLTPIIDGIEYNNLQRIFDDKVNPEFIDYNISKRLSSAVDNAKAPDMFFRNDNLLTAPINNLFDSLGINEYTTHNFLNQPIIRMLTEVYQDGEYTPNRLYEAVSETWKKYIEKYNPGQHLSMPFSELTDFGFVDMSTEKLQNISPENVNHEDQLQYLNNFLSFHRTGRELTAAYTIINQDKGADQSTFGALQSFKDRRSIIEENKVIKGLSSILEGNSYPLQKAYKDSIDRMLEFGSEFFIHGKHGVEKAKEDIRILLNKENLSDRDHKTIEEAMMLYILSKEENSPLKSIFTSQNISKLLMNKDTNVASRLQKLKEEFPRLNQNAFIKNIIEHPDNIKEGSLLTRVKFQNLYSFTKSEQDSFTRAFDNLLTDSEPQIRQLALDLISVSLLSNGFTAGHDSFIDVIPIEALKRTSNHFYEQYDLLDNGEYFGKDFAHDFIRNYYYTQTIPQIRLSKEKLGAKTFTINALDSRIYSRTSRQTANYFTVGTRTGLRLFVKISETADNVTYTEASTKGIPFALKEFNITNLEGSVLDNSVLQINTAGKSTHKPGLPITHESRRDKPVQDNDDAVKRCININ